MTKALTRFQQVAVPQVGDNPPKRGGRLTRAIGKFALGIIGWRFTGQVPDVKKLILLGAPHTTNWDLYFVLAAAASTGLRLSWLTKHTIFRWPFKRMFYWLGGIPINRTLPIGVIEQSAQAFNDRERFFLAIAPEGTRKRIDRWKTGFHRIALAADVPICPVAIDYKNKIINLGPLYTPGETIHDNAELLEEFYKLGYGKYPEAGSPIVSKT